MAFCAVLRCAVLCSWLMYYVTHFVISLSNPNALAWSVVPVHKGSRPRSTAYACLAQTVCRSCGSRAPPHCRVSGVCVEHSQLQWHPDLRRTAYDCLMRMAAAVAGLNATINLALDAVELETAPLVRYSFSTYKNTNFSPVITA